MTIHVHHVIVLARAAIARRGALVSRLLNVAFVGGFGSGLLHIELSFLRRLLIPAQPKILHCDFWRRGGQKPTTLSRTAL